MTEVREHARSVARGAFRRAAGVAPWAYNAWVAHRPLREGTVHDPDFEVFRGSGIRRAIDVGANRGQSIVSLRTVLPGIEILALEANPRFVPRLRAVAKRRTGVQVLGVGCSAEPGVHTLHIPSARGIEFDQWASLVPPSPEFLVDLIRYAGFRWCRPQDVSIATVPCVTRPLDEVATQYAEPGLDLIKIDVEGTEREVLLGARHLVQQHRPVILAERAEAAADLLIPFGYEMWRSRHAQNTLFVAPDAPRGLSGARLDRHFEQ